MSRLQEAYHIANDNSKFIDLLEPPGLQARAGRTERVFGVWTGFIQLSAGQYEFGTTSDDGSMLYIDGQLVVNNDGLHGSGDKKGSFTAPQAGLYSIRAEWFNNTGEVAFQARVGGNGIEYKSIP